MTSVLGDTRSAEIHPGDGYPWINCPFCSSPVYLAEPHPDHSDVAIETLGVEGECHNPWCPANPKMPLDAARLERGRQHLAEMEAQERERNAAFARARIEEAATARMAALRAGQIECLTRGACYYCWSKTGKFIRHRKDCPR
jgi:hypothetical protein